MSPRERVVLDTSIFVNPDVRRYFGDEPTSAFLEFLNMASELPEIKFYMPPSVLVELGHFVKMDEIPPRRRFVIIQKPPRKLEADVPAYILYELIRDVRRRIDKGLRIAEDALRRSVSKMPVSGEHLATLRGNYRRALREGIIDSTEDVDLVLLARELEAILVSADKGVVSFADNLGVRWIDATQFRYFMDSLAEMARRSPRFR